MKKKTQKKWTESEVRFLKNNIDLMTLSGIARALGRSKSSIFGKVKSLDIVRSPEAAERFRRANLFKKGHVPWTKGMKGVHFSPGTEFKKDHLPVCTKYDGCITTRTDTHNVTYRYIRIAQARWQLYHRYVWEKHNGRIPPAHIVGFRNGDTLDCRIENLYCMSKADNIRRNRNYESDTYVAHTLFPRDRVMKKEALKHKDLLELKRAQLKLRRAIHEAAG